jgi:nitroreductase
METKKLKPITVMEAIENRRSIRKFKPDSVPDEIILQLLECARLAPSEANSQPWRFVVLTDSSIKKRLMKHCYNQRFIENAPCIIACCVDLNVRTKKQAQRRVRELITNGAYADIGDHDYVLPEISNPDIDPAELMGRCVADCAIATEHIVLAAMTFGLGTCWIGGLEQDKVHELLNLPDRIKVVSLLALGYPAQSPRPRPRVPLEDIILQPIPEACTFKEKLRKR